MSAAYFSSTMDYAEIPDYEEIPENFTEPYPCPNIFYADEVSKEELKQTFIYATLIPAAIFLVITTFVTKRKRLWPHFLGGRPGVSIPMNLIEERDDRFSFLMGFFLTAWQLTIIIQGESPFSWKYSAQIKGVMILLGCLLLGLFYYPVFGTISARHVLIYVLGTLFIWNLTFFTIITNLPCEAFMTRPEHYVVEILLLLPMYISMVYLCFFLPIKGFYRFFQHRKTTGNFLRDNKELFQVAHVQRLMVQHRNPKTKNQTLTFCERIRKKIYRPKKGFRYSLSILTGIYVGIFMVYNTGLFFMNIFIQLFPEIVRQFQDLRTAIATQQSEAQEVFDLIALDPETILFLIDQILFWSIYFQWVVICAFICAITFTSLSLLFSLKNYRKHLMDMYKGRYAHIPKTTQSPRNVVLQSSKFVGYQFGYAFWGFVIQSIVIFLVLLAVTFFIVAIIKYGLWDIVIAILQSAWPIALYLTVQQILQNLIVHFVFLQRGENGERVLGIDNKRLFCNFQYFMIFANAPLGLFSSLFRLIKAVVFGIWIIPRLDVSTLARSFERFDNGFYSYIALLQLENAQTNPVMIVFTNLLQESIRNYPKLSAVGNGFTNSMKQHVYRSNLVRNRWNLFITLHFNPGLRIKRKQFLGLSKTPQPLRLEFKAATLNLESNGLYEEGIIPEKYQENPLFRDGAVEAGISQKPSQNGKEKAQIIRENVENQEISQINDENNKDELDKDKLFKNNDQLNKDPPYIIYKSTSTELKATSKAPFFGLRRGNSESGIVLRNLAVKNEEDVTTVELF